jgi:GntR family transcriptional regulator
MAYRPNRASPVPIYQQIADHLRQAIKSGTYASDDNKLPSERQLAAEYDVSVLTIRQAIAQLRSQGLVQARQGKGVFVRERPRAHRLSRTRLSRAQREAGLGAFMTDAAEQGFAADHEVDVQEGVADDRTAELLGIDVGEPVIFRNRRHLADGRPVQLSSSRLPRSITAGTVIEQVDSGSGGIYARLEEIGHRLVGFDEMVGARQPTPEEAVGLQLDPSAPVLTVTRLAYTKDRVVEVNDIVIDPDFHELLYHISAD